MSSGNWVVSLSSSAGKILVCLAAVRSVRRICQSRSTLCRLCSTCTVQYQPSSDDTSEVLSWGPGRWRSMHSNQTFILPTPLSPLLPMGQLHAHYFQKSTAAYPTRRTESLRLKDLQRHTYSTEHGVCVHKR